MGKIAALATLKEYYGSVEKYIGSFKVELHEIFVKWYCKKKSHLYG